MSFNNRADRNSRDQFELLAKAMVASLDVKSTEPKSPRRPVASPSNVNVRPPPPPPPARSSIANVCTIPVSTPPPPLPAGSASENVHVIPVSTPPPPPPPPLPAKCASRDEWLHQQMKIAFESLYASMKLDAPSNVDIKPGSSHTHSGSASADEWRRHQIKKVFESLCASMKSDAPSNVDIKPGFSHPLPTQSGSVSNPQTIIGTSKNAVNELRIGVHPIPRPPLPEKVSPSDNPMVKVSHGSQTGQSKIIKETVRDKEPVVKASYDSPNHKKLKDIAMDKESDKRDIISAMESVLNTLRVYEAKKQEASAAKAEAAGGFEDEAENSWENWEKLVVTHLQLTEAAKKDKVKLTNKATDIQTQLLLLLRDEKEISDILDDMHVNYNSQLAQVEEEIKKANEAMDLQRGKAQKSSSLEKQYVENLESIQALRVEAKMNNEFKELLSNFDYEVGMLKEEMESFRGHIIEVKKDFEHRCSMLKPHFPRKLTVGMDSSISSYESNDSSQLETSDPLLSFPTGFTFHPSVSSHDTEGYELSDSFKGKAPLASAIQASDSDGSVSVQRSQDPVHESAEPESDFESEASEAREDGKCKSIAESEESEETDDSEFYTSDSETYEESEDYASESETAEESEYSESEISEESEDYETESEASEASDLEADAAATSQNATVTVTSLAADPSEAVSSKNTIISISTGTQTEHELTNETSPAVSTGKTLSDDEWDFCGHSDSDA